MLKVSPKLFLYLFNKEEPHETNVRPLSCDAQYKFPVKIENSAASHYIWIFSEINTKTKDTTPDKKITTIGTIKQEDCITFPGTPRKFSVNRNRKLTGAYHQKQNLFF